MLDVGCGEGVLTVEWAGAARRRAASWGSTSRTRSCAPSGSGARGPNLEFRAEEATRLSFSDDEFDLASAIEVLEHVPEPEATLAEMARVARGHLLVSVPREPLWRGLNMARGAYWRDLGNTPGHVNHWSKRGVRLAALALRHGRGGPLALPLDHAACPALGRYGRGAAILSVGIGATGIITFAYFSLASYSLSKEDYGHITLLWSAVFITVSVLYRPVEQLLSRTIADRDARGVHGNEHLRIAATIQLGLGVLFAVVALLLRDPIENDLFGGSSTLYWILVVSVLAYAASYFARGYLAGHREFPLYGGLVLMEASSRCLFALAVAIGIAEGQTVVALGMAAAPIVSLAVVPPALARRLAPRRERCGRPRSGAARRRRTRRARGARAGVHARRTAPASRPPCC